MHFFMWIQFHDSPVSAIQESVWATRTMRKYQVIKIRRSTGMVAGRPLFSMIGVRRCLDFDCWHGLSSQQKQYREFGISIHHKHSSDFISHHHHPLNTINEYANTVYTLSRRVCDHRQFGSHYAASRVFGIESAFTKPSKRGGGKK